MRAYARFRLGDGVTAELGHGDLIGRLQSAALVIDDPRVSEAHAMVSLRRGELYLLALRRLIASSGTPVSELRLRRGLAVQLADGVDLTVEAVATPERVLALRGPGLGMRALAQVASVIAGRPPRLIGRFVPGAAAHVWSVGEAWRLRVGAEAQRDVGPGDAFAIDGCELELCTIEIGRAGHASTLADGAVAAPLRIVAYYDSIELHRPGRPVLTIGGVGARIVSELVAFAGPVSWEIAAREIWPGDVTLADLRHRWDVALARVRARLKSAGVRADLIRTDGIGGWQLVLYDGDEVVDRT